MTMPTAHARGTPYTHAAPERVDTTGGASAVATNLLLTSGTYRDTSGDYLTIYPDGYPTRWQERHYHYPWYPTVLETHTHVTAPGAEKPHEVVQRALKEIAQATRALQESAEAMGVPVEAAALEEAITRKLHEAIAR